MRELTTIGDYNVKVIGASGGAVRYEATHVVLPRRAIIDLVDPEAPQSTSIRLLRRACILDALHHSSVPRVFECGMLDGRPWVAFERNEGITLEAELRRRRLEVDEVLDLLEHVGAILSHAHARSVLHRNVTVSAIIRDPVLVLTGWDNASASDDAQSADGREDVFALAKVALDALPDQHTVPPALASLLAKMLADDLTIRPTAAEVVAKVHAIREARSAKVVPPRAVVPQAADDDELDAALESLIDDDADEVVIEYLNADSDDEPVLLEPRRRTAPWTPRWSIAQQAVLARGSVEIGPRTRRARKDAD